MALSLFTGIPRGPTLEAQLSESSDSDRHEGLPVARWKGRRFIEEARLFRKGSRIATTWVKDHGVFVREIVNGNVEGIPDRVYRAGDIR